MGSPSSGWWVVKQRQKDEGNGVSGTRAQQILTPTLQLSNASIIWAKSRPGANVVPTDSPSSLGFFLTGEVGFLAEDRRINVAVTRARRHVAVICDTRTVSNQTFLKRLVDYFSQYGEVRTAFEYLDNLVPENYTQDCSERQQGAKLPAASGPKKQPPLGKKLKAAATKPGCQKPEASFSPNTSGPGGESPGTKGSADGFKAMLVAFLESRDMQLDFPPSLNSHDRMLVHLMAEEYGLQHVSTGEGRDRYISVRKKEPAETSPPTATPRSKQLPLPQPQHPSRETPVPAEPGGSSEGSGKVDLKTLHLERVQREKARQEEAVRKAQEPSASLQGSSRKKDKREAKGRSLSS